jgi:hypothetical protein
MKLRISMHALEQAKLRMDTDDAGAERIIQATADNGRMVDTPNGKAIRFRTHQIGVAREGDGWVVTTFYPITLRGELRKIRMELGIAPHPGKAAAGRRAHRGACPRWSAERHQKRTRRYHQDQ